MNTLLHPSKSWVLWDLWDCISTVKQFWRSNFAGPTSGYTKDYKGFSKCHVDTKSSWWNGVKLVRNLISYIFIHIHTLFIPFCWMISSCCFFFGSFLNFSFSPGKYRDIDGTNLDNVALARKRLVRNGKMETREWWKVGTQQADDSFNAMFFCDYFVLFNTCLFLNGIDMTLRIRI